MLVALGCVGLALAVACTSARRRTGDDTLEVIIESVVRDVDPRFVRGNYELKLSRLVAPGLTSVDNESLEPQMLIATEIRQVDELVWEATLRRDARFPDGSVLTAEDVAYTYQSMMDPALKSPHRRGMESKFRRVTAVSEFRVQFVLHGPLGTLLSDLDFGIVSARAARAGGGVFANGRVVGAGPYQVTSHRDVQTLLERNPHYFGDPPILRHVRFRTVRDQNARALMAVGGSADLIQNSVGLDLVDAVARRPRVRIDSAPSAILSYLMMNNDDDILSNVLVRQAIAYAIDRPRIVEAKLRGRAVLATGLIPPMHWAYDGSVVRYGYEPDKSRTLLDRAGYPDPDGPGGQPRFHLTYKTSADQFRIAIARIIASQLGEVGIAVDVRPFEFATFFTDVKKGNYELASMQTTDVSEPDLYHPYFHSARIPTPTELTKGNNRWRYRNVRIDALIERGRALMEREDRQAVYQQIQQILARDVPIVPLWHEHNVAVMNESVHGYRLLPNARFSGIAAVRKSR